MPTTRFIVAAAIRRVLDATNAGAPAELLLELLADELNAPPAFPAADAMLRKVAEKACPRCGSLDPARHPAVQFEGEVQVCPHPWHGAAETTTPEAAALLSAVDTIKRTGGAVEIAGVRIEPCDDHGRTDTTRALDDTRHKLGAVTADRDRWRDALTALRDGLRAPRSFTDCPAYVAVNDTDRAGCDLERDHDGPHVCHARDELVWR